jgi:hypothetical protein
MSLCFIGENEDGVVVSVVPISAVKSIKPSGSGLYEMNFIDGTEDYLSSYSVNTLDIGMSLLETTVYEVRRSYDQATD